MDTNSNKLYSECYLPKIYANFFKKNFNENTFKIIAVEGVDSNEDSSETNSDSSENNSSSNEDNSDSNENNSEESEEIEIEVESFIY